MSMFLLHYRSVLYKGRSRPTSCPCSYYITDPCCTRERAGPLHVHVLITLQIRVVQGKEPAHFMSMFLLHYRSVLYKGRSRPTSCPCSYYITDPRCTRERAGPLHVHVLFTLQIRVVQGKEPAHFMSMFLLHYRSALYKEKSRPTSCPCSYYITDPCCTREGAGPLHVHVLITLQIRVVQGKEPAHFMSMFLLHYRSALYKGKSPPTSCPCSYYITDPCCTREGAGPLHVHVLITLQIRVVQGKEPAHFMSMFLLHYRYVWYKGKSRPTSCPCSYYITDLCGTREGAGPLHVHVLITLQIRVVQGKEPAHFMSMFLLHYRSALYKGKSRPTSCPCSYYITDPRCTRERAGPLHVHVLITLQIRVVQGKEPAHFMSMFEGKMIIFSVSKTRVMEFCY